MHPLIRAWFSALLLPAAGSLTALEQGTENRPVRAPDDFSVLDERSWVESVSRRRQPISQAAQAVTVISEQELLDSPAATLPDRLRYLSGVDVYQSRHAQYDVGMHGINGLAAPRTLCLVGGRSIAIEEQGVIPWMGRIHSTDIERVEVVKGPASVAYGANAAGGVVSIRGREPGDRPQVVSQASLGDHGLHEEDITVLSPAGSLGRVGFYVKASAGRSGADDLDGERGLPATHEVPPLAQSTGSTDLAADRAALLCGARLGQGWRLELDGRYFSLQDWDMIEELSPGSNRMAGREWEGGLRLRSDWLECAYSRKSMHYSYANQKVQWEKDMAFLYDRIGSQADQDLYRVQATLPLGRHTLTGGGEYTRLATASNAWSPTGDFDDRDTWREIVVENRAAFIEDSWQLDEAWALTTGLRVDDHDLVGLNWSPRVSLNWLIGPHSYSRLSFLSGYRLPVPLEAYLAESFYCTDPDLEAETIRGLDLGWQGGWSGLKLGLGAFYNRIDGLLVYEPLTESQMAANWMAYLTQAQRVPGPFFELRNLDSPVHIYGAEANASLMLVPAALELWGSGTAQRYRFEDPLHYHSDGFTDPSDGSTIFAFDRELPDDINGPPRYKAAAGLTLRQGPIFAILAYRYHGSRQVFALGNSDLRTSGELAVAELPAWHSLDLAIGLRLRTPLGDQVWARLGLLNILDSRHHEAYPGDPAVMSRDLEEQYSSQIGRAAVLSAGFAF